MHQKPLAAQLQPPHALPPVACCSVVDGKLTQVRLPTGTNRASLGYMSR